MGTLSFGDTTAINNRLTKAGIGLHITEGEDLEDCVQNTWYSPSTATLTGDLQELFTYTDGQITYIGTEGIKVRMMSIMSLTAGGGLAVDLEVGNALNEATGSMDSMPATSTLGGYAPIIVESYHDLVTNDTLDFYIRQTSESSDTDIAIAKATFSVIKVF